MSHRFILALAGFALWPAFAAHAALKDYPFRVASERTVSGFRLVAQNDGPSTITAHVGFTADNARSDVAWPVTVVLRPYTSHVVATVARVDRTRGSQFSYATSFQFGDVRAQHAANARYRLPFSEGSAFLISQAYGGPLTTHAGTESEYAIDFTMPEGTPVLAARDGVVVDVTLAYRTGALDPQLVDKANSVSILHDDGTVAQYGHLAPFEAPIQRGRYVTAGTLIGYSGNTGYSQGPHLHFAVTRPEVLADGIVRHVALPVTLYVGTPPVEFQARRGFLARAVYTQAAIAPLPAVAVTPSLYERFRGRAPEQAVSATSEVPQPRPRWGVAVLAAAGAFSVLGIVGAFRRLKRRSAVRR